MMTMASSRVWLLALAALGCGVAAFLSSRPLDAQGLATPSFTDAQTTQGKTAFDRNCASCHGANLDDGEFGPPTAAGNAAALSAAGSPDNSPVPTVTPFSRVR